MNPAARGSETPRRGWTVGDRSVTWTGLGGMRSVSGWRRIVFGFGLVRVDIVGSARVGTHSILWSDWRGNVKVPENAGAELLWWQSL